MGQLLIRENAYSENPLAVFTKIWEVSQSTAFFSSVTSRPALCKGSFLGFYKLQFPSTLKISSHQLQSLKLSWPHFPTRLIKCQDFIPSSKFLSCLNPNWYDCQGAAILNTTTIILNFITSVTIKMGTSTFRRAFLVQK